MKTSAKQDKKITLMSQKRSQKTSGTDRQNS